MKLLRCAERLWCKPWLILPEMHMQLCEILRVHMAGLTPELAGKLQNGVAKGEALYRVEDGIAVIGLQGVMGNRVTELERSSGVTDTSQFMAAVRTAAADAKVEAIVLDVDSPGGEVTGVPEAAAVVVEATKSKPVVAHTAGLMASAAYYVSAGADAIIASESARGGSIGVYMAWLDESRKFEREGLKTELIRSGKFKGMGMRGLSLNDEERAHLQAGVDKVAGWFRGHVRANRGRVRPEAMEGQTFYAADGVVENLIDYVGSFGDAMNEAKEMAQYRAGKTGMA